VIPEYSNDVHVLIGSEEIILNWNMKINGEVIHNVSQIVISPSQMKRLANYLADSVSTYEDTFGEIKIPNTGLNIA
jgi:hypothetical protein